MEFIDPHIELFVLSVDTVLNGFDLLFDFYFYSGEVIIGDKSGKEFFFGGVALLFQYHLLSIKSFLVFVYGLFATAVYFLDLSDHSIHECRSKFDQFEKIGDLLFQIPDLYVFVGAFDLIAGPVAMIVGFIFLRVMFCGISLSADRAECQASQYEIKLLTTAGVAIVFGHH